MKSKEQIEIQLKMLYNQLGHQEKFTQQYDKIESWTKALEWVLDHEKNGVKKQ